jgi:hypothetical protein
LSDSSHSEIFEQIQNLKNICLGVKQTCVTNISSLFAWSEKEGGFVWPQSLRDLQAKFKKLKKHIFVLNKNVSVAWSEKEGGFLSDPSHSGIFKQSLKL